MEHPLDVSGIIGTLYTVDELTDFEMEQDEPEEEFEDEEEAGPSHKAYEEKNPTELEKYNKKFDLSLTGVYMDEDEGCMKIEYDVLYEELCPQDYEAIALDHDSLIDPRYQTEFSVPLLDAMPGRHAESTATGEKRLRDSASLRSDVLSIEYEKPELINGQKTYQRLVLMADTDGESVYDLAMRKLGEAGIKAEAEYDGRFDSMLFTSINGRAEGVDGNFNEFYVDGEIGKNSADKEMLEKGKLVEIRYAEESDGSCGGVPDYNQIKSLLEQGGGPGGSMNITLSFRPYGGIFAS